jgi:hypothetical protein
MTGMNIRRKYTKRFQTEMVSLSAFHTGGVEEKAAARAWKRSGRAMRAAGGLGAGGRHDPDQVGKRRLCAPHFTNTIILPRQARDNHRKSTQKARFVSFSYRWRLMPLGSV